METTFRWYRKLLALLPFDFRRDYGREMEQDLRDLERRALRRQTSLWRIWWMLIADLARTAPREHLDILRQDFLYALRSLRQNLSFAAVAVLTLAIGIGANTGIFTFVNSLLLQPVQASEPERVVRIFGERDGERGFGPISYPTFQDIRARNRSFHDVAAHRAVSAVIAETPTAAGGLSRTELVSGNYFSLLGARAAYGRVIVESDDSTAAPAVAVLSHSYWQRTFAGRNDALGATVYINSSPFTVVGIAAPGFQGTYAAYATDAWVPIHHYEQVRRINIDINNRDWGWIAATARLRPEVTLQQAQADLDAVMRQLRAEFPQSYDAKSSVTAYRASRMPEEMQAAATRILGFCLVVVFLVLLLACANIAGVMLARVLRRRHEIAVRRALGADISRLVRQWSTEALLIAVLGGVAGLVVTRWTQVAMLTLVPPSEMLAFAPDLRIDGTVMAFTAAMVLLSAFVFGVLPAMRTARIEIASVLKEASGTTTAGRERQRWQSALVITQAAVSVVLLVGAGLLARSLANARSFDVGFRTDNVLLAPIQLRPLGYSDERAQRFYTELLQRLRTAPGIDSATFANIVPLSGNEETHGYRVPGHEPPQGRSTFPFESAEVAPGYFETLGIPIVRGRSFEDRDLTAAMTPVIVNEEFARRFWPNQDPIGKQLERGMDKGFAPVEVVGVARNAKYYTLAEAPMPYLYVAPSAAAVPRSAIWVIARAEGDLSRAADSLRSQIGALDSRLGRIPVESFEKLREGPLFPQRVLTSVSTTFAVAALVLMMIGLYGMLSQSVQQRTREIGLRLAIGAQPRDVMTMIVSRGLLLAGIGAVLGLAAAPFLGSTVRSLLFGVKPLDPLTLTATAALLLLVALLSTLLPARRAASVDPLQVLRYE